jgi:hypothetical protein
MKTIDTTTLDKSEAETLFAQLELHAANLRALLAASEAEMIRPPALAANDVLGNIPLLSAHINELEHRIGSGCPQFVAPPTGATQTRSGVVPRGHSGVGSPGASAKSGVKTLTERVLAARGVQTIEQLNALPPRDLDR